MATLVDQLGRRLMQSWKNQITEGHWAIVNLTICRDDGSLRIMQNNLTEQDCRVSSVTWDMDYCEDGETPTWFRWIYKVDGDPQETEHVLIAYVQKYIYFDFFRGYELLLNQITLITVPNGVDAQEVLDWEWSLHQAKPGDRDYARAIYSDWCESHGMTMRAEQLRVKK